MTFIRTNSESIVNVLGRYDEPGSLGLSKPLPWKCYTEVVMALAVETHPQREKIIDALLNGQSAKKIATWVSPKLSHMAIFNYKVSKIKPAIAGVAEIANSLQQASLSKESLSQDNRIEVVKDAARTALAANPILERMEKRRQDRQRILDAAEADKDFRGWAALDRNDLTANELEARLTGQLDSQQSGPTINLALLLPRSTAEPVRQLEATDVEFRAIDGPADEK